jgi:dihydrofolate reductase
MELSVFVGTSLDGFIAREDGALDWLQGPSGSEPPPDFGYDAFFATVDALVMGRATYEIVRAFPKWPYGTKPVIVLSSRPVAMPPELLGSVEHMRGTPQEIVAQLGARGWKHLYIDGGKTIQAFLAAGLITRMIINRLPILIGSGIPLFGRLPGDVRLDHVRTQSYRGGMVQTEYKVIGSRVPQAQPRPGRLR